MLFGVIFWKVLFYHFVFVFIIGNLICLGNFSLLIQGMCYFICGVSLFSEGANLFSGFCYFRNGVISFSELLFERDSFRLGAMSSLLKTSFGCGRGCFIVFAILLDGRDYKRQRKLQIQVNEHSSNSISTSVNKISIDKLKPLKLQTSKLTHK